jgi:hypothetical protein
MVQDNEFKGGPGSSVTVRMCGGGSKFKKVSIVGAGKPDKFDVKGAIKLGGAIAGTAKTEKAKILKSTLYVTSNSQKHSISHFPKLGG